MISEQDVINWVSQMIARQPNDVQAMYPHFRDQYRRDFRFWDDTTRDSLWLNAYLEQDTAGTFWIHGTIKNELPAKCSGNQNTATIKLVIESPSDTMRAAWTPRVSELLHIYGYDRSTWPRLAWQRA